MSLYQEKLTTAAEAVKLVRSGDRIYIGTDGSFAYELLDALWERRNELEDITVMCTFSLKYSRLFGTPYEEGNPFRIESFFMGKYEKIARDSGMPLDYTSFHLSQIGFWCEKVAKATVCFLEVSPQDENGYFSFGPGGTGLHIHLLSTARTVILEVNKRTPYITGKDALIHISQVSALIETNQELTGVAITQPDPISTKISEIILPEIPDGATIQLGMGGVSTAVGFGLKSKNELGIYSEIFSDPMKDLMINGNVTNRNKGFHDGVSVYGIALGSQEMYDFMDHNAQIYGAPLSYVNDPRNIAKNKRVMSINTAMAVDLFGQVSAETIGWKQFSAVGGQIDFVKGSQWSEGGKSFIALASTFEKHGQVHSKIVLNFMEGTVVTTPRSEVQYIATEYGCVNLKELNMSDRVRAMISIAHPDFRDELTCQAKDHHLI